MAAATSSYRVAVVNESWAPLSDVDVEAMNLTTLQPDDVQRTGRDGVVVFTGLPAGPHFFRARARRVSTKVGGRTYTGQVRLQVIAMGNQGITKHYVVDANGMGTHTTLQAAVTAAIALGSGFEAVIYCNPGTYSEDLTVPFGATAGAIYLVGEGTVKNLDSGTYNSIVTIQGTTTTDPVMELSGTGSLSVVGIDFKPRLGSSGETIKMVTGNDLELNDCKVTSWTMGFTAVIDLRCRNCIISTGGRIIDTVNQAYFEHCYLSGAGFIKGNWDTLVINDCILLGTAPAGEYWIEEDTLVISTGLYVTKCIGSAGGGGGFIKCGDPSAASNDCIIAHNKITLSAGEKGIYLVELTGAVVTDNVIEGASNADGSTAIEIAASAACRGCVIAHNSIRTIQNGVVVGANGTDGSCVIGPNAYYDVDTETSGVPAAEDYQVSLATASCALLDGTIHTDTVAQGVTAGSIIIGNDTPAWDELAISVPAASVLNVLGITNGETTPSWKTVLDGTNPANIANSASPGTSLVFAHRDHVHAHPAGLTATLHHTKYTGAEAIAAVEGEATLALDGAITEIHGDANFTLSIVSSNPRLTLDSGDYLEYNRASNYLYHNRDFLVDGHMAIGGAALDATDVAVEIGPTFTHTSGLARGLRSYVTANPAGAASTGFQGLRVVTASAAACAQNFTATQGLTALTFAAQHFGSGLVTGLYGANFYADIVGAGNVTVGVGFRMRGRTIGDSSGKFVTYYNLYIDTFLVSGSGAADNLYGIYIADLSQGTSLNYAIYLAGTSGLARQGIWWNGDTNLYRSAANVLKTDDSFVVGADLNVTTETYLGLHTLTGDNQADVLLFSNAAGSHAQAGNFDNKLKIYGGGGQGRRMELYQDYAGEAYVQSYAAELHLRTTSTDKNIVLTPDGTGLVRVVGPLQGEADVYFTGDGSGLPYGHMHGYNISETVGVAATDTFYELTTGLTGGELNLVTLGTAHELTVTKAGRYLITWSMSVRTGTANDEVEGSIAINNTASTTAAAHTTLPKANASTTLAGSTVLDLAATDDISMAVMNHTAIRDIVVEHVTCTVVMVGGT